MTNRKLVVDVWGQSPSETIKVRQGEVNSRLLDISIVDGNKQFNLAGKSAIIYMTKPDGKIIFNTCQIINATAGEIRVALTSQMSIAPGLISDVEIHIVSGDKTSILKVSGICIDVEKAANVDAAVESTNECTALLEALKKADEALAHVTSECAVLLGEINKAKAEIEIITNFVTDKGVEIDNIVKAKMQSVDEQMTTINSNAAAAITKLNSDGSQAIQEIKNKFTQDSQTYYRPAISNAVATAKTAADGANAAATNANTATTNANNAETKANTAAAEATAAAGLANTAATEANAAAEEARTTAETTATNIVNNLKGEPNGIASLDANAKLVQMPTAADVGAVPITQKLVGKRQHGGEIFNDYLNNQSGGRYSHSEGFMTNARGDYSHTEGVGTTAPGFGAHAQGSQTTAPGYCAHAQGVQTTAAGYCAHAGGFKTISNGYQTVIGSCNIEKTGFSLSDKSGDLFIIGNGIDVNNRSNAFRVEGDGQVYGGAYHSSGADFAELFEWIDDNDANEDRRGLFVTLDGEKIKPANPGDYILGVVSTNPTVIGNSGEEWSGRYLRDVFGNVKKQRVHYDAYTDDNGIDHEAEDNLEWMENPDYDPNKEWIDRKDRKEWAAIGMMGQLVATDDGSCQINGFCTCGINGVATHAETGYRVLTRLDDNHIRILVK